MRAWAALAILCALLPACTQRERAAVAEAPAESPAPAQLPPPVPLMPPEDATEVRPGTFVRTTYRRPSPGAPVEQMREIFFINTIYDETGREAATSVPSSSWSMVPEAEKVKLRGMRSGDRRRSWTCANGRSAPCRVEDVQVFDGAEPRP